MAAAPRRRSGVPDEGTDPPNATPTARLYRRCGAESWRGTGRFIILTELGLPGRFDAADSFGVCGANHRGGLVHPASGPPWKARGIRLSGHVVF